MNGFEVETNVDETVAHETNTGQRGGDWATANQGYLALQFARLKELLRGGRPESVQPVGAVKSAIDPSPMIDRLSEIFGLSPFEREVLLLCAGVEMDSELAGLCADLHGQSERTSASFGLALSTFADPHWSALAPQSPLRRYRLLEIDAAHGLTAGALRVDERVLHYLAGVNLLDPRLEHLIREGSGSRWMAESQQAIAATAADHLIRAPLGEPAVHLFGDDPDGQEDTAGEAALQAGLQLYCLRAEDLPAPGVELDLLAPLWSRETLLLSGVLLVQLAAGEVSPSARHFIEGLFRAAVAVQRRSSAATAAADSVSCR